jgi:hypothetical protein
MRQPLLVEHDRCRLRPHLGGEGERIGFQRQMLAMRTENVVFVVVTDLGVRDEQLPITVAAYPHRVAPRIPEVEVTDHADPFGAGGEHDEADSVGAVDRHRMRAELIVEPQVGAFPEQIKIVVAQDRQEAVGIVEIDEMIAEMRAQVVTLQASRQRAGKQACVMNTLHRHGAAALADHLDA